MSGSSNGIITRQSHRLSPVWARAGTWGRHLSELWVQTEGEGAPYRDVVSVLGGPVDDSHDDRAVTAVRPACSNLVFAHDLHVRLLVRREAVPVRLAVRAVLTVIVGTFYRREVTVRRLQPANQSFT